MSGVQGQGFTFNKEALEFKPRGQTSVPTQGLVDATVNFQFNAKANEYVPEDSQMPNSRNQRFAPPMYSACFIQPTVITPAGMRPAGPQNMIPYYGAVAGTPVMAWQPQQVPGKQQVPGQPAKHATTAQPHNVHPSANGEVGDSNEAKDRNRKISNASHASTTWDDQNHVNASHGANGHNAGIAYRPPAKQQQRHQYPRQQQYQQHHHHRHQHHQNGVSGNAPAEKAGTTKANGEAAPAPSGNAKPTWADIVRSSLPRKGSVASKSTPAKTQTDETTDIGEIEHPTDAVDPSTSAVVCGRSDVSGNSPTSASSRDASKTHIKTHEKPLVEVCVDAEMPQIPLVQEDADKPKEDKEEAVCTLWSTVVSRCKKQVREQPAPEPVQPAPEPVHRAEVKQETAEEPLAEVKQEAKGESDGLVGAKEEDSNASQGQKDVAASPTPTVIPPTPTVGQAPWRTQARTVQAVSSPLKLKKTIGGSIAGKGVRTGSSLAPWAKCIPKKRAETEETIKDTVKPESEKENADALDDKNETTMRVPDVEPRENDDKDETKPNEDDEIAGASPQKVVSDVSVSASVQLDEAKNDDTSVTPAAAPDSWEDGASLVDKNGVVPDSWEDGASLVDKNGVVPDSWEDGASLVDKNGVVPDSWEDGSYVIEKDWPEAVLIECVPDSWEDACLEKRISALNGVDEDDDVKTSSTKDDKPSSQCDGDNGDAGKGRRSRASQKLDSEGDVVKLKTKVIKKIAAVSKDAWDTDEDGKSSGTRASIGAPAIPADVKPDEAGKERLRVKDTVRDESPELPKEDLKAKEEALDKPVILTYSRETLRSFRLRPECQRPCPSSVPFQIRVGNERPSTNPNLKKYHLQFLKQFREQASCQAPPQNHKIPRELLAVGHGHRLKTSSLASAAELEWRSTTPSGYGKSKKEKKHSSRHNDDVLPKFEPSASSWSSKQKAEEDDPDVKFLRNMKSIMNKLTIEKFDTLYLQLIECSGFDSKREHIEALMKEIFEKATTQHHFIEMYTSLCLKINEWLIEQHGIANEEKCFKRILLNQCQESFEKYLKPPDPEGMEGLTSEEQFEKMVKYKTRMLGNMKLVGQLLINKMLSSRIIFQCTDELLHIRNAETLETLCVFLKTIGPTFDVKEWGRHVQFEKVMGEVKKLLTSKKIAPRIRCLLQDLVDLQASGWAAKRKQDGPTTLAAVHEQWQADYEVNPRVTGDRPTSRQFSAVTAGLAASQGLSSRKDDEWVTRERRTEQPNAFRNVRKK